MMPRHYTSSRQSHHPRSGAIVVLLAVLLPVLLLLACFAVNVAYMEMLRSQLRISCDSAAKAALINFGATQNQTTARTFARTVSANNTVGGTTLQLADANIEFGNATKNTSGTYVFTSGAVPMNSSRVTGTVTIPYLFTSVMPAGSFTTSQVSLTSRISHDIVLVLDRSASMAFDLTNSEFSYPADRSTYTDLQNYFTPPSMTGSRWKALTDAVNSFITVLQARNLDAHVSLVTYAEAYTLGNYSATQVALDVPLTATFNLVPTAMNTYALTPLLGDTNIAAGMNTAVTELTGSRARTTADRTIILLTDGVPTTGNTNIPSLTLAARTGSQIVTHVITFGGQASTGAIQTSMMSAAANGNGMFFNAATAAQLTAAFQKIADSLPAVLIN